MSFSSPELSPDLLFLSLDYKITNLGVNILVRHHHPCVNSALKLHFIAPSRIRLDIICGDSMSVCGER